ncbi:MAG: ABC transporter substrate-binding protein [Hungatella sp.]
MKKRALAMVMAAVMVSGSLAACKGTTTAETTKASEAATAAATTTAAGTTTAAATELPFAGQKLTISNFSFNAELLQKNIYDPFMKATGCELIVEGGKNSERVTKIKESPANYDVVVIGDAFIADLIDSGFIETIDRKKLTNVDALYEIAKAPFGEDYGPVYSFNRLGIVYDSATVPMEITSWEDLWNADLKGSIAIPDITATTGPLFYYSVAKMLGLAPGTDDEAIFAKLQELKPNVVKTYTSANDTITMLNQGEISAAVLLDYSYTAAKAASEDYVWVDPKEGSYSGYNTINVIKGTKNKELAEEFVNFYISKEVQLAEALDGVDSPARTDIELTPKQSANFTYGKEMVDKILLPDWSLINTNKAAWTEKWNELFSVK